MNEAIPPHIIAAMARQDAEQAKEDSAGIQAATATLPGPMLAMFSPSPSISVGPYSVRRFVDRDFILLSALDHPLKSVSEIESYPFHPTGEHAWQLCWLLTRDVKVAKLAFKNGVAAVKELASDEFGDYSFHEIAAITKAILEQIRIYGSARLDYKPASTGAEGENSSPPQ